MTQLQVAIDISAIPFGRGVSRYTSNLVEALAARPEVALTLTGAVGKDWSRLRSWAKDLRGRPRQHFLPVPPNVLGQLWNTLHQPSMRVLAPGAQVVHVWEWQTPPVAGKPWVVTIHDLAHLLFPETAHPEVVRRFQQLLARVESDPTCQVIAVSESTKKDIIRLTSIEPDRITVVAEALPLEAKYVPSRERARQLLTQLQVTKPYFLFVGTSEPRKNLQKIIAAWQGNAKEQGYDLVLAGAPGWDNLPEVEGLHQLGYVPAEALAALYQQATALLFPTLYEGFGLPILEAFYHGCLVVTSRVSSMPEVAGDAAVLVDPYTVENIAEGIEHVLHLSPAQKTNLQKKMRSQLNKFSWERPPKTGNIP